MKTKKLLIATLFFTLVFMSFSSLFNTKASAASSSFLMNTKKIYTYSTYNESNKKAKEDLIAQFIGKHKNGDLWDFQDEDEFFYEIYLQDNESLQVGDPFDGTLFKELVFPLTAGKKWDAGDETTSKVVSLNNTVKTPAGTFKNVVSVDNDNGFSVSYYAPGIGLVKYHDKDGDVFELTKLENAHYGRVLIKEAGIKMYTPKGAVHRTLKKGEALKVFKESNDAFDVGGGYYVKKSKATSFYTGFIYGTEKTLNIYSPDGKVFKKASVGETIRVVGFKDGKYLVGGGYYVPLEDHICYER